MKDFIEKSQKIALRKTRENDLDFVIQAEREEENAQYVGQWTREQHIKALNKKDIMHLLVEDMETGKAVGYTILAGVGGQNQSIEFRRIVITEKGKGYGSETLSLVKKLAFEQLKAHRLWLDVRYANKRAQKVYKAQGFIEEGILRECVFYNNEFQSLIVMSILKQEYEVSLGV